MYHSYAQRQQPRMAAYPPQYQHQHHKQPQQPQFYTSRPSFSSYSSSSASSANANGPSNNSTGNAAPPYQGAPPPMPTSISVNPQHWQAGYWQYNPQYNQNRNPHQQHVPWIPAQSWIQPPAQQQQQQSSSASQQQQQQASHNPYKRVPRPPSAEYLATKLVDNPLGLSGMDEPNPNYGEVQTPWVWQPRKLDEEDEEDSPARDQESFTAKRQLQPTFSINIVRTPEHYRRSSSGSTDTSSPSRSSTRSRSSVDSALSAHMSSLSTSASDTPSRRSSLPSSASPTKPEFCSASSAPPILVERLSDEPASMLSPLIIAQTPKATSSPLRSLRGHPTYPVIPAALAPIPESSNDHGYRNHHNQHLHRPHATGSLPVLPKSQGSLTYNNTSTPPPTRRDSYDAMALSSNLGSRHTTFIDPHISMNTYTAKPTRNPSPPRTPSPRHTPSRSSSRHSSRPSSTQASPTYPPGSHVTPPNGNSNPSPFHSPTYGPPSAKHTPPELSSQQHKSSSSTSTITPHTYSTPSRSTSTSSNHNPNHNPLPPPPTLSPSYAYIPTQHPAPAHYHEKIRKGYWNRRGDHLTLDGYIVFAPPERTFPNELRNYPAEDEGYQDHEGLYASWVQRPELPQSLPRMGKPPEVPYEKFVVYEYR